VPYDEELAHRIRELLAEVDGVSEMAMFGGLAFMVEGNIAVAASSRGELMVRLGQEGAEAALKRPHARLFDMAGKVVRGWVLVAGEGTRTKTQLRAWVRRGVDFAQTLPPKG
jgi:TfoX/Sxy family transcriptional regulator of competence genes